MKYGVALAVFGIIAGLLIFGMAPDFSARMRIDQFDATLTADLFGISPFGAPEFRRYLTIQAPSGALTIEMAKDWGPARRTSIYVAGNNQIAILGPAHDDYFVSLSPLRLIREPVLPAQRWIYLGAFDLYSVQEREERHRVFRFVAASQEAECIPTLLEGDSGGPHRTEHYQRRCPL